MNRITGTPALKTLASWISLAALAGVIGLQAGCGSHSTPPPAAAAKRVAIVPFRTSGNAESGQYALLLSNFSEVLATQFGATSPWQVMESERLDTLQAEQALEGVHSPPTAENSPLPVKGAGDLGSAGNGAKKTPAKAAPSPVEPAVPSKDPAQWAAAFPAADYILLGQINGFDVRPVDARSGGATLARRQNRIRSRIDVRIVDVHTRAWLASRSVRIDEQLSDDSAAETQIHQAMSVAARKVVNAVLLAAAGQFNVTESKGKGAAQVVSLNGGTHQGVEVGQTFRALGASTTTFASQVQIVEAYPDHSVAKVIQGAVAAGDRVPAEPLEAKQSGPQGESLRIAVGRFFLPGSDSESQVGGVLLDQIKQQLLLDMSRYSGLSVVEDRNGNLKDLLSQQMLDDLSKGRDPGLPMGSLHGVDYLIFGNVATTDTVDGRREVTHLFGTDIEQTIPPKVLFDGTVYILDVNSGEYMTANNLSMEVNLQGQTPGRAVSTVARAIGDEMFRKTLLQIRPLSVVETQAGEVVLNHTEAVGLAVGDRFTAMSRGEDRLDPNTHTWMRNVGGQVLGELEISRFDAGGWAHAVPVSGALPAAGTLLVPAQKAGQRQTKPSRKLSW